MQVICTLILEVLKAGSSKYLISVDEKTGIQALERIHADQPAVKGAARRLEYEYERNGTTTLMAAQEVATGKVLYHRLHPTRKEEDFLAFIQGTLEALPPRAEVIILADQLNTHRSASLVEWVAEQTGFSGDLGKKHYKGILKHMESRRAFLEKGEHRIRFLYTPKHCSWLNPIENWFSKLERHVIRYGNFPSVEVLERKIEGYIGYYNRCLFKALNWTFKGFTKGKELRSINYQ